MNTVRQASETRLAPARAALGFLSVVRLGSVPPPDHRATAWLAPVGGLIGLVVGGAWWLGQEIWPPLVAAVVVVGVDAALTGLLHYDGLGDSADGLLPPLDRARRLAVMADPRAGGFSVVTVTLVLALRVAALAAMRADVWLLAGLWAASRGTMAVALATLPYARPEGGLASAFRGSPALPGVLGTAAGLVVATVASGLPAGPVVALAAVAGAGAVLVLAQRRLAGFTGDVLGAAGLVGETVALTVAAARW